MLKKQDLAQRQAKFSDRLAKLDAEKRALLEKRLRTQPTVSIERIPRRSGSGPAPLSFAQQRLWFLDQLEPVNPSYNIPFAVRMTGQVNIPALFQSLNQVIRRHEALRTTFIEEEGQPLQVVAPTLTLTLPMIDLRAFPEVEQERRARQLAREESERPFDLARGPLIRASLLRLNDENHVLLLTMHHIVSDGWSVNILIRELVALYQSFLAGRPSPLPELPLQYADFAGWQRQW